MKMELALLLIVGLAALVAAFRRRRRNVHLVSAVMRTTVGLRRARLRLQLAEYRHEVRSEACRLQRELSRGFAELDDQDA
jgi:heme/copper-type cytochrome/quinol oxidase subunit 3